MIVCLCNALSDARVGQAIADGAKRPKEVYEACKCRAQCGTCLRVILGMLRGSLASEAGQNAPAR